VVRELSIWKFIGIGTRLFMIMEATADDFTFQIKPLWMRADVKVQEWEQSDVEISAARKGSRCRRKVGFNG
jgi:hypothetical protein